MSRSSRKHKKPKESRREIKEKAVKLKGGKCQVCGYDRCIAALTFHHINPAEKKFGISSKGHELGWESVKKEIKNCLLLCSNCHSEHHEGLLDLTPYIQ